MPNYTINEVIIHDVNQRQQAEILAKVNGAWGPIDFSTLLPVPINHWHGSAGKMHEYVFPGIMLDWCTQNWSTKWNAVPGFWGKDEPQRYLPIVQTNTSLTLTFQTAWSPPCGWIVALFNTFHFKMSRKWIGVENNELGCHAGRTSSNGICPSQRNTLNNASMLPPAATSHA